MPNRLRIVATGSALPSKVVTNHDLENIMDTTDAWIVERTGIRQRHVCVDGENAMTLAAKAAQNALDMAGLAGRDIDLLLVGTISPNLIFPSVATQVQAAIGMEGGAAFDLQAACSGFIYGLSIAEGLLKAGHGKRALVIGSEVFSRILDWTDRSTAVLFGDGAGAALVELAEVGEAGPGLLASTILSDGRGGPLLCANGGIAKGDTFTPITMNGREVFRHASRAMANLVDPLLAQCHLAKKDVTWLVPHQANGRIIEATARLLDLPMERVVYTVDRHANTSAASIPLALDEANRSGSFKPGDVLFLDAFGAGFTWAGAVIRW